MKELIRAATDLLNEWVRCGHIDEMDSEPHIQALRAAAVPSHATQCYGSNPGAQAQAENEVNPCHSAVPLHAAQEQPAVPSPKQFTREELVQRILESWEMQQGKISPLTRWLAEDAADTILTME